MGGGEEDIDHFATWGRGSPQPEPGYDDRNGEHEHTYVPAPPSFRVASYHELYPAYRKPKTPEPEPERPTISYPYPPQAYAYVSPAPQYGYYPAFGYKAAPAPAQPAPVYQYIQQAPPQHAYYYPAPVPVPTPAAVKVQPNEKGNTKHIWCGRNKEQVDEDNQKIAAREGLDKEQKIEPKDPAADQLFWVVDPDGEGHALRTHQDIKANLMGDWKVDPRNGSVYFIQESPKKKAKRSRKGDD